MEHGSFGPGEMEMSEELAEKYAVFVEILEDNTGGDELPPVIKKTDIETGVKAVKKNRKRKA